LAYKNTYMEISGRILNKVRRFALREGHHPILKEVA